MENLSALEYEGGVQDGRASKTPHTGVTEGGGVSKYPLVCKVKKRVLESIIDQNTNMHCMLATVVWCPVMHQIRVRVCLHLLFSSFTHLCCDPGITSTSTTWTYCLT